MTEPSSAPQKHASRVVWISGYSGSGKTTVGRKVESLLSASGRPTILLDGDDLRSIFADRWGYERAERIELARVYFRLCSHLAAQGNTVILCAVAMYDEVRDWLKSHVPGAIEVYLDVPEAERRARDARTKRVYGALDKTATLYDAPRAADLVVSNFGDASAEASATCIVDFLDALGNTATVDHGRNGHWSRFYEQSPPALDPSPFAIETAKALGASPARILEVGCGNGRDAFYFASLGHTVLGLDISEAAIAACRASPHGASATFFVGDIAALAPEAKSFDVVYSRFSLHAMTPQEEDVFLPLAVRSLAPGGRLFIECRSINDPMARKGEVISKTERIFGHYRRFIIQDEIVRKLEALFMKLDSRVESSGLAPYGDDDPVVIRLVASADGRALRAAALREQVRFRVAVTGSTLPVAGERAVVFHGLNKSGSLSLSRVLREGYIAEGRGHQFFTAYQRPWIAPEELKAKLEQSTGHGFFVGHYLYGIARMPTDALVVTQFRHPIPRILSIYSWLRGHHVDVTGSTEGFPELEPWLLAGNGIRHSQMVQFYGGTVPAPRTTGATVTAEQALERARANIAKDVAWFGIAELLEESIFSFAHLAGLPAVPAWKKDTRNRWRTPVGTVDESAIALIREVFRCDIALYEELVATFRARIADLGIGGDLERYKQACADEYNDRLIS